MNYHSIEVLAFQKHRSMLVEAELRRLARDLPRPARSGILSKFRRPWLLLERPRASRAMLIDFRAMLSPERQV